MFDRHAWLFRGAVVPLLVLSALTAGCAKRPTAVVSGKVTYRGRPLPIGTVRFLGSDNKVLAAEISGEGNYSLAHVPVGEVKISVTVPSALTLKPQQKGMSGKAGDNPASEAPPPSVKLIKIPDDYASAETSNLKYTVTEEPAQTHDIALQ